MRFLWKRNLCGNLIAVFVCGGILAGYVSLLRYNKASSATFNIKPKRVGHRAIRDLGNHQEGHTARKSLGKEGKSHGKNSLEVFIVEEHHDVLPIWINAASAGVISQHGNTLIHIDGHSDFALPLLVPGYPFFRLPRNTKEINKMMQRNDVFIIEAAMAGLINRMIWIWPQWDTGHSRPHEISTVDLGYANVIVGEALKERVICVCFSNSSKVKNCEYVTMNTASKYEDEVKSISPKRCNVKRSMKYEEMHEDVAMKKLKDKSWLRDKEKIMLDIDEDYFGCTYASQPLVNAGVKVTVLEQMNSILKQLFCPKSSQAEIDIDKLLYNVLGKFLNSSTCKHNQGKQPVKRHSSCRNDKQKLQSIHQIKSFLWQERKGVACSKRSQNTENLVMQLVELFFSHMNPYQIRALQYVGFCLSTSLNSFIPVSNPEFRTCMGNNNQKESVVTMHKPTRAEVATRTTTLGRILEGLKEIRSPQIVTVCRSVRDGYTPRGFFRQIEKNILKTINTSFSKTKLQYGEGLLGGKKGWPGRHMTQH